MQPSDVLAERQRIPVGDRRADMGKEVLPYRAVLILDVGARILGLMRLALGRTVLRIFQQRLPPGFEDRFAPV
jgi:hypothetical protein